jgi:hypothetical protein
VHLELKKIFPSRLSPLSVKTKPILNLSLKAEKARLSEIAEEMAKRLKVQGLCWRFDEGRARFNGIQRVDTSNRPCN